MSEHLLTVVLLLAPALAAAGSTSAADAAKCIATLCTQDQAQGACINGSVTYSSMCHALCTNGGLEADTSAMKLDLSFGACAEKHLVDGGELGQFMCKSETSSPTVGCKLPFNWGGSAYSECTAAEDPFGPWCATAVDDTGEMTAWGHCDCESYTPAAPADDDASHTNAAGSSSDDGDGCTRKSYTRSAIEIANPSFEMKASSTNTNTILGWQTVAGGVGTMAGGGSDGEKQAWISAGAVVQTLEIVPSPDVKYVFSVSVSAEDGWLGGRYRIRILSGSESMCEARGEVVSGAQPKIVSVSCWGSLGGGGDALILSLEGFRPSGGPSEGSLVTYDDVTFDTYAPRCLKQCSASALDVVLAVDVSGSTREGAVDAAVEVVRQLDLSRVSLSLVTFSDEANIAINFNTMSKQDCSDAADIELEAVARQAGLSAPNGCAALVTAAPVFCAFPVGLTPLASYCEQSCGRCATAEGAVNAADVKGEILKRLESIRVLKLPNRKTNIGKALETIARAVLNATNGWRADPTTTRVLVISDGLTNGDGETVQSFKASKLKLTSLGVDLFSLLVPADPFSRFTMLQDSGMDVGDQLASHFGIASELSTATSGAVEEGVATMVNAAFCSPQPPPPPPQCACVCQTCATTVPPTVEPAGPLITTTVASNAATTDAATTNAITINPLCGSAEAAECNILCSSCIASFGQGDDDAAATECKPCVAFCSGFVDCLSPANDDDVNNNGLAVDDDDSATTTTLAAASVDAIATAAPTPTQCVAKANNCHTCSSNGGECTMCKNAAFLQEGVCIAACPLGTKSAGKGNFGKRCEMVAACTPRQDDCHTCNGDSSACTMCRNAAFLNDGVCVAVCPSNTKSAGKGNFNKRCEEAPAAAAAPCVAKANNCHQCNADSTECLMCKNAKFLSAGACVGACPTGTKRAGKGNFNKRCEIATPTVAPEVTPTLEIEATPTTSAPEATPTAVAPEATTTAVAPEATPVVDDGHRNDGVGGPARTTQPPSAVTLEPATQPNTVLATTTTTITTQSPAAEECGCTECMSCRPVGNIEEIDGAILNPTFERGNNGGVTAPDIGTPVGWSAVGSTKAQIGVGSNGLLLHNGNGVQQATTVYPSRGEHYGERLEREYIFQVEAVLPQQYERAGFTLAPFKLEIVAGDKTLSVTSVTNDDYAEHKLRQGNAAWHVETRWRVPDDMNVTMVAPLAVRIVSGGGGEGTIAAFRNVAFKKTSDGCQPKYPACNEQVLAITIAIDYSGSASFHREAHIEQAKILIRDVYDGFLHEQEHDPAPRVAKINVQVRTFSTNLGRVIWNGDGIEPALSATSVGEIIAKLDNEINAGATAAGQLNRFTNIGGTVLEAQQDFGDADLHAIVIISDGDADGSDRAFNASMRQYSDLAAGADSASCVYAVGTGQQGADRGYKIDSIQNAKWGCAAEVDRSRHAQRAGAADLAGFIMTSNALLGGFHCDYGPPSGCTCSSATLPFTSWMDRCCSQQCEVTSTTFTSTTSTVTGTTTTSATFTSTTDTSTTATSTTTSATTTSETATTTTTSITGTSTTLTSTTSTATTTTTSATSTTMTSTTMTSTTRTSTSTTRTSTTTKTTITITTSTTTTTTTTSITDTSTTSTTTTDTGTTTTSTTTTVTSITTTTTMSSTTNTATTTTTATETSTTTTACVCDCDWMRCEFDDGLDCDGVCPENAACRAVPGKNKCSFVCDNGYAFTSDQRGCALWPPR